MSTLEWQRVVIAAALYNKGVITNLANVIASQKDSGLTRADVFNLNMKVYQAKGADHVRYFSDTIATEPVIKQADITGIVTILDLLCARGRERISSDMDGAVKDVVTILAAGRTAEDLGDVPALPCAESVRAFGEADLRSLQTTRGAFALLALFEPMAAALLDATRELQASSMKGVAACMEMHMWWSDYCQSGGCASAWRAALAFAHSSGNSLTVKECDELKALLRGMLTPANTCASLLSVSEEMQLRAESQAQPDLLFQVLGRMWYRFFMAMQVEPAALAEPNVNSLRDLTGMDKRTMYYIAGWLVRGLGRVHVEHELASARDDLVVLLTMSKRLHEEAAPQHLEDAVQALENRDYTAQRGKGFALKYATGDVFKFVVAVHAQLACLYTAENVASMSKLPRLARIRLLRSSKLRGAFRVCVEAALEEGAWMPVSDDAGNASVHVQGSTTEKAVEWLFGCAVAKLDKLFGYHFARDVSNKHVSARSQAALRDELKSAATS